MKKCRNIFKYLPPVVIVYLGYSLLCTLGVGDLSATKEAYSALRSPLLYAMIFVMLLRCDLRKIMRLGPRLLFTFFVASFSIGLGFVLSYILFKNQLGYKAYDTLGIVCGTLMGGTGNLLAIQTIYGVEETRAVFALMADSTVGVAYCTFLYWLINHHEAFNCWTKADTRVLDDISLSLKLEKEAEKPLLWQNIMILLGVVY